MEVGAEDLGAIRVPAEKQMVGGERCPPDLEAPRKNAPQLAGASGCPSAKQSRLDPELDKLCNRKAAGLREEELPQGDAGNRRLAKQTGLLSPGFRPPPQSPSHYCRRRWADG